MFLKSIERDAKCRRCCVAYYKDSSQLQSTSFSINPLLWEPFVLILRSVPWKPLVNARCLVLPFLMTPKISISPAREPVSLILRSLSWSLCSERCYCRVQVLVLTFLINAVHNFQSSLHITGLFSLLTSCVLQFSTVNGVRVRFHDATAHPFLSNLYYSQSFFSSYFLDLDNLYSEQLGQKERFSWRYTK